jgi:hypothetical protein
MVVFLRKTNASISYKRFEDQKHKKFRCKYTISNDIFSKDLRKAVESLHKLGNDFRIINTGSKRVICSVSIELSQDNIKLLEVAEEN